MELIDGQSTISIYGNRNLVTDIRPGPEFMRLVTNGGEITTNLTAIVPGFHRRVWFHDDAVTNILALHHVTEKHRVTYDSARDSAFHVHHDNGVISKFEKTPNGLHAFKWK